MSLLDDAEKRQESSELRAALNRALRQLDTEKASQARLVDAVYRAAHDAAQGVEFSPVPKPPKRKGRNAEVAVAMLSDWQLGKTTPDYDSAACERRIAEYGNKVVELTEIQRADHPVNDLRVWLLGDLVEGELIFPGQAHRIDASLFRQVMLDGPRILGNFLRQMLASFDKVTVLGVIGNHGAIGGPYRREMHPESNADRMLYEATKLMIGDHDRLEWIFPEQEGERAWYAIDRIGAYSSLLFHGDQVRGALGMPWYGFYKAINGWGSGALHEDFLDAACGHWHQSAKIPFNHRKLRVNGSTESYNTWAQESLKAMSNPSQWLMFVHPDKGMVTAEYEVALT